MYHGLSLSSDALILFPRTLVKLLHQKKLSDLRKNIYSALDESNSIGVLGSSGRGLTEHCKVQIEKIDIATAAIGNVLVTEGGFCTGSARVIDHQRLSSSGYVFSASLPLYLASAAITAVNILEDNPQLTTNLKKNISILHKDIQGLEIASDLQSPICFSQAKEINWFKRLLKEDKIFETTSIRSTLDKCKLPVWIKYFVSAGHTESNLTKAYESVKRVAARVLSSAD